MPLSTLAPYPAAPNPGAVRFYRCSWSGIIRKTLPVETPADALYHVWSRYRDHFVRGEILVAPVDAPGAGDGSRGLVVHLEFPVTIERTIEAPSAFDALRTFMFNDLLPPDPPASSLKVEPMAEPDDLERLVPRAAE